MTARYIFRLAGQFGTGPVNAIFDSWRSLTYRKRINDFGIYTLVIDGTDERKEFFTKDASIDIWRSDKEHGIDWYSDFSGFHRTPRDNISSNGLHVFTSYGREHTDLLRRRALAYKAPYEKDDLANTVMGELVEENLGASATVANGRIKDGTIPVPMTIDTTTYIINGPPPNWKGSRAYKNLLEVLQEIAAASNVDFTFNPNGTGPGFIFRTFFPHAGIDRTVTSPSPTIFSPEFGNAILPDYTVSATEEVTSIIVAGQGEDNARIVEVVQSTHVSDSDFNDIELVRDARGEADATALQKIGDAELANLGERENFVFQVLQTPGCLLGRDYNMGDLVTVRYGNIVRDKKIIGIDITITEGKENIKLEFGEVGVYRLDNGNLIKALIRRLHDIEHGGDV